VLTGRNAAALAHGGAGARLVYTSVRELANTIALLSSDAACGVSGQNIVTDSGLGAQFCCNSETFDTPML